MSRPSYPFERSIPHESQSPARPEATALTIGELEQGLHALKQVETDRTDFWAENGSAFRETVLLAIRETSDALQLDDMPPGLRAELEGQLAWLRVYLSPQPPTLN